jgi:hypothetical protein
MLDPTDVLGSDEKENLLELRLSEVGQQLPIVQLSHNNVEFIIKIPLSEKHWMEACI